VGSLSDDFCRCGSTDFQALDRGSQWSGRPLIQLPEEPSTTTPILVVATPYDPSIPSNKQLPKSLRKNPTRNYEWTEIQRKFALKATRPSDLENFGALVSALIICKFLNAQSSMRWLSS
jgi:hypothetical protein